MDGWIENMPSSLQGVFLDCILGWAVQWFGGLERPPDLVEKKQLSHLPLNGPLKSQPSLTGDRILRGRDLGLYTLLDVVSVRRVKVGWYSNLRACYLS